MNSYDQVMEAAAFLRGKLNGLAPRVAIVLGSGLGAAAEAVDEPVVIPYSEIPHYPQSTVEGHAGRLVAGRLNGAAVLILQGRVHLYEGYSPEQLAFPMRVLGALGVEAAILTNASGGINPEYRAGQLAAIEDHINLMGCNPLIGPNEERFGFRLGGGLRFPDMTEAYSKELRQLARKAAAAEGYPLAEGVYLAVTGPSFETPAEIRAFRALGADMVGMSTVPETIAARHVGIEVLGLSCVTNPAAGMGAAKLSHEEVFAAGQRVEAKLIGLLKRLAPMIESRIAVRV
jgi:purine-nucleoside phosphorylase